MARASRSGNDGLSAGAARGARRGLWGLARLVRLVTSAVVGLILVGIALVVLEANKSNEIVSSLLDAARFLAGPLDDAFKVGGHKATVAVNWGVAALAYALIGSLLTRLLRR